MLLLKICMNTLIIENADKETTALFRQLAKKLGLRVRTESKKNSRGIITNPDLLKRIKYIEEGKAEFIHTSINDLKKLV